jgi:hypothetical protein
MEVVSPPTQHGVITQKREQTLSCKNLLTVGAADLRVQTAWRVVFSAHALFRDFNALPFAQEKNSVA